MIGKTGKDSVLRVATPGRLEGGHGVAGHIRNTERCSNTKRGRSRQERNSVHELEGTLRSASRSSLPRPGGTQGPRLGESMLLGHRVSSPPSSSAVTRTCLLHEMLPVRPPPVRGPRLLLRPAAVPLEAPVLLQPLQVAHVNVLVGHRPERGSPAAEGHCGQRLGCHAGSRPWLKPKAGAAGPQELPKPTPLTRGAEAPASPARGQRCTPPGRRHLSPGRQRCP